MARPVDPYVLKVFRRIVRGPQRIARLVDGQLVLVVLPLANTGSVSPCV